MGRRDFKSVLSWSSIESYICISDVDCIHLGNQIYVHHQSVSVSALKEAVDVEPVCKDCGYATRLAYWLQRFLREVSSVPPV